MKKAGVSAAVPARNRFSAVALVASALTVLIAFPSPASQPAGQIVANKPALGTVQSITGRTIALKTDAGVEVTVTVEEGARLLRIEPGEKDLKNAVPLQFQELQPGDRILVRGKMSEDGKSLQALSVIAMKKGDIAQKQAHEREEWQKRGVGGLVSSADPATGVITISTNASGPNKTIAIHTSKDTILRRYAPGSIKFDDAKPAPLDAIKPGDQLRARGTRNPDGTELTADEIVSGSFRNIAGTVDLVSPTSITVTDLATKKQVIVNITADSQLRRLEPPMAERIAARLKGGAAGDSAQRGAPGQKPNEQPAGRAASARSEQPGGAEAPSRSSGAAGDLQQAISKMPPATIADLHKGDAVMIVATSGEGAVTAITLLAGVEPILQASPKGGQSILTPWSMSGAPGGGGEGGNP